MLKFAWDETKAAANLAKHGVSFEEAATVFGDPFALTFNDPEHSSGGTSVFNFWHVERGRTIRIISARKATKYERGIYEQG